jgi:hypothetical protein
LLLEALFLSEIFWDYNNINNHIFVSAGAAKQAMAVWIAALPAAPGNDEKSCH